ncbi:hypothetical protein C8R44DRAFT_744250 [Mycena epipterygia]|nr:hypothetical protein C8R44DRAFT_744250 [Mycena epipterygia]
MGGVLHITAECAYISSEFWHGVRTRDIYRVDTVVDFPTVIAEKVVGITMGAQVLAPAESILGLGSQLCGPRLHYVGPCSSSPLTTYDTVGAPTLGAPSSRARAYHNQVEPPRGSGLGIQYHYEHAVITTPIVLVGASLIIIELVHVTWDVDARRRICVEIMPPTPVFIILSLGTAASPGSGLWTPPIEHSLDSATKL